MIFKCVTKCKKAKISQVNNISYIETTYCKPNRDVFRMQSLHETKFQMSHDNYTVFNAALSIQYLYLCSYLIMRLSRVSSVVLYK